MFFCFVFFCSGWEGEGGRLGFLGADVQKQNQKEKGSVPVRHQCRLALSAPAPHCNFSEWHNGWEGKKEGWIQHRESKVEGEERRQCEDSRGEEIEREMQETMGTAPQPFELSVAAAAAVSSRSEKPSTVFV